MEVYNDELGRVNSVNRHETAITNTYDYNINGWTTNIHSEHSSSNTLLFDEQIHYTDGPGTPYYNGNISSTKYITYDHPMGENTFYAYKYSYDGLDRLTKASYGYGPTYFPAYVDFNMLDEEITYDANSNIISLIRHGQYGDGVVDNLIYSYNGNRVYSIHDSAPTVLSEGFYDFKDNKMVVPNAPEYGYDGCGSITYDLNKGINHIDYDYLGNPTRIQFADYNVTEYVYSADGRRLKSIHRTAVPQSHQLSLNATHDLTASEVFSVDSTEYINDFEFKNGSLSMCKFDGGYLAAPFVPSTYRYYITDHLGNNSLVVNGNGSVQQATHYYPFGSNHHSSTNQGNQKYKYNGKEFDEMHGLNEYDYGARQYDPAIGMFTSMDPLCEKYYHISPYSYCGGNPVSRVDVDGRMPFPVITGGIGAITGAVTEGGIALYRGQSPREIFGASVRGAIEGGVIGAAIGINPGLGIKSTVAASAVSSSIGNIAEQLIVTGSVDLTDVAKSTTVGILGGAIGIVGTNLTKKGANIVVNHIENKYASTQTIKAIKKEVRDEVRQTGQRLGNKTKTIINQKAENRIHIQKSADKAVAKGVEKTVDYTQQTIAGKISNWIVNLFW